MITYKFYKFPEQNSVPQVWPTKVNLHEVGQIVATKPVFNNLNVEISAATFLSGWHVNVCFEGDVDLSFVQQYEITVEAPICKWFGQP
jgi:hypothetical protein